MLKRNIAILIAGGLLGVQAGLASAESAIPPSGDQAPYVLLPAQVKHFEQRAAQIANERSRYLDHDADGHMTRLVSD